MEIKIRSWKIEDAEPISKILNNKKILDNLRDGIPFPYFKSDAENYINSMLSADPNAVFSWAITADGVVVGSIGVFRSQNVHRLTAEMGYYIGEELWGKGIMTKAVKQACKFVFENSDIIRIFAEPYAFNAASCRVLEKAGFACEGTLRKNAIKNDKIEDMKMYSILKE